MSDPNSAFQGCGEDCRAAEQGWPAPCEMYPDDRIKGCPRQAASRPPVREDDGRDDSTATPKLRQVRPHIPGPGYTCRACEKPHIPGCNRDRDDTAQCPNLPSAPRDKDAEIAHLNDLLRDMFGVEDDYAKAQQENEALRSRLTSLERALEDARAEQNKALEYVEHLQTCVWWDAGAYCDCGYRELVAEVAAARASVSGSET